jgi:hypothetical protein
MGRKIKIYIACGGVLTAIAIISITLLILFGMEDKIEIFFYFYFTVGVIGGLIILWPFFSKRLK